MTMLRTQLAKFPTWVWIWTLIALSISSIPPLAGMLKQNSEASYSGVVINETDTNSYFANMQQGWHGEWVYTMPYNSPPSKPVPLFTFYILSGHIARILHLSIPLVFHIARLLSGMIFALVSFIFITYTTPHTSERKFALIILLFSGGLGWLVALFFFREGTPPVDFWFIDGYGYTMLLTMPHFSLNAALMIAMLLWGEAFMRDGDTRKGIAATLSGVGIAFMHPHQLAIITLVLGILRLRDLYWQEGLRLTLMLIPGAVLTLITLIIIRDDPYLSSWAEQGNTYTFPLPDFFIAYGFLFPLAFVGLWHTRKDSRIRMAALWFLVGFILMYVPVNFQRRFVEGWQLPLALLAAAGWNRIRYIPKHQLVSMLLLTTTFISPLLITLAIPFRMNTANPIYFVSQDEQGALNYLEMHGDLDTVVLSSYERGNGLAARAGIRSFIGHWSLTAFVKKKWELVEEFFDAQTLDEDRKALLREYDISYLFYSDTERELGDFAPQTTPYLMSVYESPSVILYAVLQTELD